MKRGADWAGARFGPKVEIEKRKAFLFTNIFIFSNSFDSNSNLNAGRLLYAK
jgi:hypothetical protein